MGSFFSNDPSGTAAAQAVAAPTFELEGEFQGFFEDFFGKKRMVLSVKGEERYLKVPKELRRQLSPVLHKGQPIVVVGHEVLQPLKLRTQQVVTQVRVNGSHAAVSCPIRVCAKKNCWKSGGKEMFQALEREIQAAGLQDSIELKAVGCMDYCKQAPNVACGGEEYHRCRPGEAKSIVARIAGTAA